MIGMIDDPQALEEARVICREALNELETATVAQLRDAWGMTRKHSIPLCEYFDAIEVTSRDGNNRSAGPAIDKTVHASARPSSGTFSTSSR